MLTVHHLGKSQSERIVWLCEELEIPYDLKVYTRDVRTMLAPPEYKALHPLGIAPVITEGDLVLGESGAIMEYIIWTHGGGRLGVAPGQKNYPEYLFWMHMANGTLMSAEIFRMYAPYFTGIDKSPAAHSIMSRAERTYEMIDVRLGQSEYLVGDSFTAADIINLFPLTTMRAFVPRDLSAYPNILAYLKRMGARPAYQRAMAKGDPGMKLMLE